MAHFLDKLLGDPNTKTIKRLRAIVDTVNALEPEIEKLADTDLVLRSQKLQQQVQHTLGYDQLLKDKKDLPRITPDLKKKEQAVLDKVAPEAFALVREAAKRTLGQRHFDVQLIAGLVLHEGNITEQRTGEGKTLSATTAVYLNALVGRGSHVITVNDYLARRDAGWMGQIYDFLGMSVAVITHDTSFRFTKEVEEVDAEGEAPVNLVACTRQEAYRADITYGTNNEFGFDYLRDNMAPAPIYLRQRPLYFAVVDEVDSILIDEARTPLIISANAEESGDLYAKFAELVPRLHPDDYTVDEKERAVSLTDAGMAKMARWLNVDNIYEDANILLVHHLEEALKAQYLFILDKDYVVREGEVLIVDQFTGRLMPGRRYSEGLHQAIEAKEGVHVQRETDTLATISFQNFFRLYSKLSGMTGTAKTEEEEFLKLYDMEVIVVPTHRDMIRVDHADMVYIDEAAKFDAIIETIKERRAKQQPLLIGTISVAKNEHLGAQLTRAGIPHEILNAKNHEKEAAIISQAGMPGAVTLATNMAGRGTDIMLGGPAPEKADTKEFAEWEKRRQTVLEAGGLCVIGSERHESRRIDNQLRGRAGRQGEPGESIFYVSMDDDLMRIFGGEKMKGLMERLKVPRDMPIQSGMVSRSIEQSQKRVEGHNFDIRKHVVQYDDVMNKHRDTLYAKRYQIMAALGPEGNDPKAPTAAELREVVRATISDVARQLVAPHTKGDPLDWPVDTIADDIAQIAPLAAPDKAALADAINKCHDDKAAIEVAKEGLLRRYDEKEQAHSPEEQRLLERAVFLKTIDALWVEHLNIMSDLRQGVGLQAIAQHDPLVVYQQRGYEQFKRLLASIDLESIRQLFHLTRVERPVAAPAEQSLILQGASEADAGGAISVDAVAESPADIPTPQVTAGTSSDPNVNVTIRRVSERLAAAGRENGQQVNAMAKVGRNDPCPCGSGKKFKKCHGA